VTEKEHLETSPPLIRWRNPDTKAIAVLLGLTLMVITHRWIFDNWLARHDLLTFFLPWLGSLGDRLGALDIPTLNPYLFSGAPFTGDPESGWMYLPAMLVFPFFEVTVAYKLMILLLLVVAGTSTYAFARVIGYGVLAALFSAVSFEFGPYLFGQTDCCTVGTMSTAFLPMTLLGIELALRAMTWPTRLAAWTLAGFAISQMFAAWLGQGVINALVLVAAWTVFRTLITPPELGWNMKERLTETVTTGPAVLILGLLLGAAGILPRLQANAESNNAGGTYETTPGARDGSFHTLASVLKSIMVDSLAFRGTSIWGTVLVLMVLAVFLMRRRSVIPFFATVAIVIPALAMGVPLISDLFYLLPLYENMHIHSPGRILWIYPFVPAMLAGAAVNELPRLRTMRGKWFISLLPLPIIALGAWYVQHVENVEVGIWFWIGSITAIALVLVILGVPTALDRAYRDRIVHSALALLVALTFLLPNGVDIIKTIRRDDPPPGELVMWGNDPWMQELIHETLRRDDPGGPGEFLQQHQESEPPFRFIAYGGMYHPETIRRTYPDRRLEPAMVAILQNARAMRLGLETTQGYNPLQPLVYQEFIRALNGQQQDYHYANLLNTGVDSPLLDVLNVRYIVVDRNIPEDREDHRELAAVRAEVFRNEDVIIYESPTVQPRAWMVYDVQQGYNQVGLALLANGDVDGAEVAYVQDDTPPLAPPTDGVESQVRVSHWSPDSMTLDVSHTGVGLLVVSEIYSENWKAIVDGHEVHVLQTDHALLGIPLGPGEHVVEVIYAPDSLTLGLWVSGISAAGCIAALGYAGWSRRASQRRSSTEAP
jgi:hypothetical protein